MFANVDLSSGQPRKNARSTSGETARAAGNNAQRLFLQKSLVLSSAVAGAFLCSAPAMASFEYVTHWGRFDTSGANAAFNGPTDVAFLKSNGNLLIADSNAGVTGGGEVVIQQANGTYVTKVASVNDQGPVRSAVDPASGDVYISTYYESKIRRYTEAGGTLTLANTWTGCTANGGNGPYTFGKTFGVATDSTGAIYVADYDNLRVLKMNTAGQCAAAPLTTYTKNGAPAQVFLNMTGLAVDSADNLWVADYGKQVLVKYNSAGVWQTTLTGFSNCGTTTAFNSPKDIDIDTTTNDMFVMDGTNGIIKLDSSGNFLTKVTKYNTSTTLSSPFGGGFTSGFYYATDYGHSAVVKYTNPTRKVAVTASAGGTVAADVGGVITGTTGGNTCTDQFVNATTVVLTATPNSGYTLSSWGGADGAACTGNTCTLTNIAADKVVTATFAATASPAPVVSEPPSIPTGGGTATLGEGDSVRVKDNGSDGTSIALPSPVITAQGTITRNVNISLPGTGSIGVSSSSNDTKLGVTHVTLPGATTSVSTVTVDQGSATFTASQTGQAMGGLKNGIVVVSGSRDSQVTLDTTGQNARIGVKSSDTIIVPTGSTGVSGTKVDLPPPTASGGQASTVNLAIGGQELTVRSTQANTTMTFQVVDVGGVKTPVLAVTGAAQVTTSGDDKPIVSVGGSVIKSGKSGSGQICNTIVQASSDASSDVVHVVTCYIVLPAGTFSALNGGVGNNFAAIKDGVVWAGETAEFDKAGVVTGAYLGSKEGTSDAVGDNLMPGGAKFAATGSYQANAFIPRLAGTSLRLKGAKLDESIFNVINNSLGLVGLPTIPGQSSQGVLNFQLTGTSSAQGVQNPLVTYAVNGDIASMAPSRRVRVDTSRADGVSIGDEGAVEVVAGGLVTTFVPAFIDPSAFADATTQFLPGSSSTLRSNGSWQVVAKDGTTYVLRPQWSYRKSASVPAWGAAIFSTAADGNLLISGNFSGNRISQYIFPDFYDYNTLQATFRSELNDSTLSVQPRMDGTAVATVNGKNYTLRPQWTVTRADSSRPAWWKDNGVFYIKNSDGTAQGFTVK